MLADLLRRLSGPPTPEPLEPEDARTALAALMVRLARTDGSYSTEEQGRIDALLRTHYRIDAAEAARVRAGAEEAEANAQDTVQFTRLVKQAVPYEERTGIVESLWKVAVAGGIHADERGLMRLVADLLGVADQDSGLARQRALGKRG